MGGSASSEAAGHAADRGPADHCFRGGGVALDVNTQPDTRERGPILKRTGLSTVTFDPSNLPINKLLGSGSF